MKKLLAFAFVGMVGMSGLYGVDECEVMDECGVKDDKIKMAVVEALQEVLKEKEKLVIEKKDDALVVSHYDYKKKFTVNLWENKFSLASGTLAFIIATPLLYKFFRSRVFRNAGGTDVLGDMAALLCTITASSCSSYVFARLSDALLKLIKEKTKELEERERAEEKVEELEEDEEDEEVITEEPSGPEFEEVEIDDNPIGEFDPEDDYGMDDLDGEGVMAEMPVEEVVLGATEETEIIVEETGVQA